MTKRRCKETVAERRAWGGGLIVALLAPILAVVSVASAGAVVTPDAFIYVSSSSAGTAGGVAFSSEDVLVYDSLTMTWEMFFDGSDVGVAAGNVDGFSIDAAGDLLLSFTAPFVIPGIAGTTDDSDVVKFNGTTGDTTSGSFSMLVDGSDVDLAAGGEDVNAIATAGPSEFVLSTSGVSSVPRTGGGTIASRDEDLVELTTSSTGPFTVGNFGLFFDGSDVGLAAEDINGAAVDASTGAVYTSILGNFNVGGVSGDGDDIIVFTGATGDNTAGTFAPFFDGDAEGFGGEQIDAVHVEVQSPPPFGEADLAIAMADDIDPAIGGDSIIYTITVTNNGPDTATNVVVTDTLPPGVSFVETVGCAPQDPVGVPTCSLGDIPFPGSALYTLDVLVGAQTVGTILNTASVTSAAFDPITADNMVGEGTVVGAAPVAVDDGPAATSVVGDPFHTGAGTSLIVPDGDPQDLLLNDALGSPAATIVDFDGGATLAGATANFTEGDLTVNTDGSFTFDPATGFEGLFTFDYRIVNTIGSSSAEASLFVGDRPAATGSGIVYVSSSSAGTVAGIAFGKEDILAYDTGTGLWSMFFDGSDVGVGAGNVDGFSVIDDTNIVISFAGPLNITGPGLVDDSDVVRFVGTTGAATSGSFTMEIDGSDVGLTSGNEDIDALSLDGMTYTMSTFGNANTLKIGGGTLASADEDAIELIATATGSNTAGGFAAVFDGSDVALAQEDLVGVDIDQNTGTLYGASLNGFDVTGLTGDGDDIFAFDGTLGDPTSGTYSLFFDGDLVGFGGEQIDGLDIFTPTGTIMIVKETIGEDFVDISAGSNHSCGLTAAGAVKCWGSNEAGQLGDGTLTSSSTPVPVAGLTSGVTAISAGGVHSCAIVSGAATCWGSNSSGALGDGSTTPRSSSPVPVVGLTSRVSAISVGLFFSCAVDSNGAATCWGRNSSGQLGDGSTTNSSTPVPVVGLTSGVSAISVGLHHSCAVDSAGAAKCWGWNGSGQLGDGTTTDTSLPVQVSGLTSGVSTVSAGLHHSCAVDSAGAAKCWGGGPLGNSTTTQSSTPVPVVGLTSGVSAVSAGSFHSCGLTAAGAVKCWGSSSFGQLGDGTTTHSRVPVPVSGLASGVSAMSAGGFHSCTVDSNGAARCWGDNGFGALGDGSTIQTSTPVQVSGLTSGVSVISAGGSNSCAVDSNGAAKCWGRGISGQLGDGSTTDSSTPVPVTGLTSGVTAISAGGSSFSSNVNAYSCAVVSGAATCWGANSSGQLGDGSTTHSSTPVPVSGLTSGVTAISAGSNHSCAVDSNGAATCWGDNRFGQLGDGSTTNSSTPVQVSGLTSGITAISAGNFFSCAVDSNGAAICWGDNRFGQLGDGSTTNSSTPVQVSGLTSGVSAISTGGLHSCAIVSGAATCWGWHGQGRLGDGSLTQSSTPVPVSGLTTGVTAISAGLHHSCAVDSNGAGTCWGDNRFGQLGDGSLTQNTFTMSSTPVPVVGLTSGVSAISAGGGHSCAVDSNGAATCWGWHGQGRLGDGTNNDSTTSVPVAGTTFAFTDDIESPNAFTLGDGDTKAFTDVPAGVYSVTETPLAGWTVTSTCSDGSPVTAIDLQPGETITCTFTNTAHVPPPA